MTSLEGLRKNAGLSQLELEARSGVSQTTISAIENGRVNPGVLTLAKLADALDVPLEKLVPPQRESIEQGGESCDARYDQSQPSLPGA